MARLECGYDWLREESRSLENIQELGFGVRMTIHGFLALFYKETCNKEEEDLAKLWDYFGKTPLEKVNLSPKLQEFLSLIALLVGNDPVKVKVIVAD